MPVWTQIHEIRYENFWAVATLEDILGCSNRKDTVSKFSSRWNSAVSLDCSIPEDALRWVGVEMYQIAKIWDTASWPCQHMSALCAGQRMDTYECYWPKPRRQWFMHSSLRILTTVTRCCSASLTICSGVFGPYKMLQHVLLLLVPDVMSTSSPSGGNFIGCQWDNASNSSWQFWRTKRWMACLHNIWRMTASLPRLPADDNFDRPTSPRVRFQQLAQVWAIAHSLLLDRVCGTTYLSIYVTLNIISWSSAGYWRRTCFAEDSGT